MDSEEDSDYTVYSVASNWIENEMEDYIVYSVDTDSVTDSTASFGIATSTPLESEENSIQSVIDEPTLNNEDSNSNADEPSDSHNTESINSEAQEEDSHSNGEPAVKRARLKSPSTVLPQTEEQDGEICPICLEAWSNSGIHRLVSLKCGHLFGHSCIERWLQSHQVSKRSCPTCKSKAAMRDLRFIYARKLIAADTSEITTLHRQVECLQADKNRIEAELHQTRLAHRYCRMELERLRAGQTVPKRNKPPYKLWKFALEKNIGVCSENGCRVMAYNSRKYEFFVSHKSTNSLFPGYGVRHFGCPDYKPGPFIPLHPKPIRDMAYSPNNDLLLTAALDGCARLQSNHQSAFTVRSTAPLWSCCWDVVYPHEFILGQVGGTVLRYDMRNYSTPLQRITTPTDVSPVVAVQSTDHGLLSCHLNSCWLWVNNEYSGTREPRSLSADGPFQSMCYDDVTGRVLIWGRPSVSGGQRARLVVYKLSSANNGEESRCEQETTFPGSTCTTLMSRACWVRIGSDGPLWAAAYSESERSLIMNGMESTRSISLQASEPILDVRFAKVSSDTMLATLSASRLRLYKAVATEL